MKPSPAWGSSPPTLLTTYGASRFHFAEPELSGLGVMTSTPGRSRSSQPLMFLGFPGRTTRVTTDPNGMPLVASFSQSLETLPALTSRVMAGPQGESGDGGLDGEVDDVGGLAVDDAS